MGDLGEGWGVQITSYDLTTLPGVIYFRLFRDDGQVDTFSIEPESAKRLGHQLLKHAEHAISGTVQGLVEEGEWEEDDSGSD